jgi:hypothetical protein
MTTDGKTSIHDAAEKGDVAGLKALLSQDPSLISNTEDHGWTPLHMAAKAGEMDTATLLLEHGADPSAADVKGWTPLHWAAAGGRPRMVRLLLSRGAQATATSITGMTPADVARQAVNDISNSPLGSLMTTNDYHEVLSILRSGGASKCFIVTAACGTEWAPDVMRLRQFRDRVLLVTWWGRFLVRFYETTSPPLARMISRSKRARATVRYLVVCPCRWVADVILRDRKENERDL